MEFPPLDQRGTNVYTGKLVRLDVAMEGVQLPPGPKPVNPLTHNDFVVVQSVSYNEVFCVAEAHHREWSRKMRPVGLAPNRSLQKPPDVGALMLVNSRNPTRCYRVCVRKVVRQNAQVFLIDIGGTQMMPWADLSPMPEDWKQIPNTLLKVKLVHHLMRSSTMQWLETYAARERFWNLSMAPAIKLSDIISRMLDD